MTLSTAEKTVHGGQPIELYEFNVTGGDQAAYRYTDHHADLNVLSKTWTRLRGIERDVIMSADAEDAPETVVRMPYTASVVSDLIFKEPPRSVELIIQRYHGNIADVGQVWKGKVLGGKIQGRTAEFRVPSPLTIALNTIIPGVTYQTICNHVLGDANCTVDIDTSYSENRTVSTIGDAGHEITVNTLTELAQEYVGGYLKHISTGDTRLIVDAAGFTLKIMRPFRSLVATDAVTVYQGCDHKITTCDNKFLNMINHGGFPYIQAVDVIRRGITGSGLR